MSEEINNLSSVQNNNNVGGPGDNRENLSIDALLRIIMFESTENLRLQKIDNLKKLATSQNEIAFLNNLRRILMLGANQDGTFTVTDELQKLINKVSEPGSEGLMQLLIDLGLNFNITYNEASFNTLFDDIDKLDNEPGGQIRGILLSLGVKEGEVPTAIQLNALFSKIESLPDAQKIPLLNKLRSMGIEKGKMPSAAKLKELMVDEKELLLNKLLSIGIERGKKPTEAQLKALVELASRPENQALRKILMKNKILAIKQTFTKAERENFIESIRLAIEQKSTLNEMVIQTATRLQTEIDQRQQYVIMALKIYNDAKKNINAKIGR